MFREPPGGFGALEFSEIRRGERGACQGVHVLPCLVLITLDVNLSVDFDREVVTACELRVAGIFVRPRLQRFVGEVDFVDQVRIGRVIAGANVFVVERVVDAEIAHLHPSEILVSRCGVIEPFALVVCVFALHARASVFWRRSRFRRRRRAGAAVAGDCNGNRGCGRNGE